MNREEQTGIIFDRLDSLYRVFEMAQSRIEYAKLLVTQGSDGSVAALATAIVSDKQFTGSLLDSLTQDGDIDANALIAAVWDPLLHEGRSRSSRKWMVSIALDKYMKHDPDITPKAGGRLIDESLRIKDSAGLWKLLSNDQSKRLRAKRFVAMESALEYCIVDELVQDTLRARTMDDNRSDHEALLVILRQHYNRPLTVGQIDFILSGGPQVVSDGAL
jgi:hypothetical protein